MTAYVLELRDRLRSGLPYEVARVGFPTLVPRFSLPVATAAGGFEVQEFERSEPIETTLDGAVIYNRIGGGS